MALRCQILVLVSKKKNCLKSPTVFYKRCVDDTFVIFFSRLESRRFFRIVNQIHPALTFTSEFKNGNRLLFLDVLVERTDLGIQRFIYRKPMFTRWGPFCPHRRKINLIKTLVHRAFMICSKSKLANELEYFKLTLLRNGYPEEVITSIIRRRCTQPSSKPKFGPERCPVCLQLLWIGTASTPLLKQIKRFVNRCSNSVK